MGEGADATVSFFPTSEQLLFFLLLLDAVVPEPGMQLWGPEAGMIPKQETVTLPLNLYVRIPKGLMGPECAFTPSGKVGADGECCRAA